MLIPHYTQRCSSNHTSLNFHTHFHLCVYVLYVIIWVTQTVHTVAVHTHRCTYTYIKTVSFPALLLLNMDDIIPNDIILFSYAYPSICTLYFAPPLLLSHPSLLPFISITHTLTQTVQIQSLLSLLFPLSLIASTILLHCRYMNVSVCQGFGF